MASNRRNKQNQGITAQLISKSEDYATFNQNKHNKVKISQTTSSFALLSPIMSEDNYRISISPKFSKSAGSTPVKPESIVEQTKPTKLESASYIICISSHFNA